MKRLTAIYGVTAVVTLALVFAALGSTTARAEDPSYLTMGGGGFDFNDDQSTGQIALEYRSGTKLWHLKPFAGAMINGDAGGNVYAGILLDIYFGNRIVLTPNFAPSYYWKGDGKDLGNSLEFRTGIELAYRFDNRSRFGAAVHHLSNASLSDNNPGTELFTIYYSIALD